MSKGLADVDSSGNGWLDIGELFVSQEVSLWKVLGQVFISGKKRAGTAGAYKPPPRFLAFAAISLEPSVCTDSSPKRALVLNCKHSLR